MKEIDHLYIVSHREDICDRILKAINFLLCRSIQFEVYGSGRTIKIYKRYDENFETNDVITVKYYPVIDTWKVEGLELSGLGFDRSSFTDLINFLSSYGFMK